MTAAVTSASVAASVMSMVTNLDRHQAEALIARVCRKATQLVQLHDYLAAVPGALCPVDPEAPLVVINLAHLLASAGCGNVSRASCTNCGRATSPIIRRGPTGRICNSCWGKQHRRECARCHQLREPAQRTSEGPICNGCHAKERAETCAGCGNHAVVVRRLPNGTALCQRCHARPLRACAECGEQRPTQAITPNGPVCQRCYRQPTRQCGICHTAAPIRRRASGDEPDICRLCADSAALRECASCGRERFCPSEPMPRQCFSCTKHRGEQICRSCMKRKKVRAVFPLGAVCHACYRDLLDHPSDCSRCGYCRSLIGDDGQGGGLCALCCGATDPTICNICGSVGETLWDGRCGHCILRARLVKLLSGPDGTVGPQLQDLADALIRSNTPRRIIHWLKQSKAARLLTTLARTGDPITHAHLDGLGPSLPVYAVRKVLVASGVLDERCEFIEAVGPWLDELAERLPDHLQQPIIVYGQWSVLHRARRRAAYAPTTQGTRVALRGKIRVAADFLVWLDDRSVALKDLRQSHVDEWLALRNNMSAPRIRYFLQWARDRKIISSDIRLPPVPRQRGATPAAITEDERWQKLHQCLNDSSLSLDVRIAGALVLLFGYPTSRAVTLTATDFTSNHSGDYLKLGPTPLLLPPKLGQLVRQQLQQPARTPLTKIMNTETWIFPSSHPGTHRGANGLQRKLHTLGIHVPTARRAALMNLAFDMPASVLADLLGMHVKTVHRWTVELKRDWSKFIVARSINRSTAEQ